MILGFSTGSLAKGDFKMGLQMASEVPTATAIELSALRETELPDLIAAMPQLSLDRFTYVSLHAPSKLFLLSEYELVKQLLGVVTKWEIPVIVHPDIITDVAEWRKLGRFLCIENMDKRKPIGRTAYDLEIIFNNLPQAGFCLDFAHAKQVDPTMAECAKMLRQFKTRLIQFHISDVTSDSAHVPINIAAIESYRKIIELVPTHLPFIIESPVPSFSMKPELFHVESIFHKSKHYSHLHSYPYNFTSGERQHHEH